MRIVLRTIKVFAPISNMWSFLYSAIFLFNFTLTCFTVTLKTLFTRTKVRAKRVLAVCVDVTNWWRLQALIIIYK